MNHYKNIIVCIISAASFLFAHAHEYPEQYPEKNCQTCASTIYLPRPQGLNNGVGLNSAGFFDPFYYTCCDKTIDRCWTFDLGFRYDQTWKGKHLAQCLWGTDESGILKFAGSEAATETTSDGALLADDYGLAPDAHGSVSFDPSIKNFNIDFVARLELGSLHEWLERFYVSCNATLTHSVWDVGYKHSDFNYGSKILPLCMQGRSEQSAINNIDTALEGFTPFGELTNAQNYGHFLLDKAQKLTRVANIDFLVGYDFVRHDQGHLGMFFKTVAPTGNRPNAQYAFSPVIGNGHHWEFGAGIDGHWDMWNCDDHCLSLYIVGELTHLFNDKQMRTFDINNCCMSRNQLLKKLEPVYANGIVNNYVFTEQLVRATDWTTRKINSSFDVQGDAAIQLLYRTCNWAFGLGYNVYGRSKESIEMLEPEHNKNATLNVATKGTTGVCYSKTIITEPPTTTYPTLNASQDQFCTKTFNTNVPVDPEVLTLATAPGVEYTSWDNSDTVYESIVPNGTVNNFTPNPTPLNETNISYQGVPRQIQHTIFGHVEYEWLENCMQPFMGMGALCSFANNGTCDVCTANQWGIWIHGGFNF